ncbi:hypothetical protein BDK51DRAFT_46589 [Blyttiomyces helicus]|uniref:Ankyrin repeat-containing domain protein n=1 Tax=Blyttiomyces helicus TaxID=388810 RepID=A0A4P9WCR6_9FUNG|nr:hypothetical protein BDK51DRAFT_46589 [Blyttiomyces helicus]|eukprot:RKO90451.1 hypothetical protein BDK51DRAFT_46589 [Blyttiomyces helicus]
MRKRKRKRTRSRTKEKARRNRGTRTRALYGKTHVISYKFLCGAWPRLWLRSLATAGTLSPSLAGSSLDIRYLLSLGHDDAATTDVVTSAVSRNDVPLLRLLHAHGFGITEHKLVSQACSKGASELIRDVAAANGHLDVVKFLHEKVLPKVLSSRVWTKPRAAPSNQPARPPPLPARAPQRGLHHCHNGRRGQKLDRPRQTPPQMKEIFIWLHENRTEGCTAEALHSECTSGCVELLWFILDTRPELCSERALELAFETSNTAVLAILYTGGIRFTDEGAKRMLGRWDVVEGNRRGVMRFLPEADGFPRARWGWTRFV